VSERYRSAHFFLPFSLGDVTKPILAASSGCPARIVDAFADNLRSVNDMLGLPFLLVASSIANARWQRGDR
jgi:hypothetical protein